MSAIGEVDHPVYQVGEVEPSGAVKMHDKTCCELAHLIYQWNHRTYIYCIGKKTITNLHGGLSHTTNIRGLRGMLEFTTATGHVALTNGHECLTINNVLFTTPVMFEGIISNDQVMVMGLSFTIPNANSATYMGGYIATQTRGPYYPRVTVRLYDIKKLGQFNRPDFEFGTNQSPGPVRIYAHKHLIYCVTQDIIQINTKTGAIFQYAGRDGDLYHRGVHCPWISACDIHVTPGELLVIDEQSCVWRIRQN
jgi:hypothetical protein